MRIPVLALFVLLLAARVSAQPPAIDSYTLRTYNVGAPQPLQTFNFLVAATVCNQTPPPPTSSTVNPTRAVWDDPANAGKVCIWTDAGGGPLFSAPTGASYEATLTAVNQGGESPETPRAPFARLAPPGGRTGFRVVR
jgi:hypothetical protein